MDKGLIGTTWPWKVVPDFAYDEDVIQTAISDVILTTVGERKMNTLHGGHVIRLVFENKGALLNALASREITNALRFHLPVISVLNVDVVEGAKDNDPVDVIVDYSYQGIRQQASVSLDRG
jgi:phage baseplate assembly protein W